MKKQSIWLVFYATLLAMISCASGQTATSSIEVNDAGKLAFTISMDNPASQCYQVVFRCEGLTGPSQNFKMPVWTPGYYGVFDFAGNVQNFCAENGKGNPLKWEKTAENTWTIQSEQPEAIVLRYDVKATSPFVAHSYLDENKGYIVATGICMYVDGQLQHPVTLTINPNPEWSTIATGLDPVSPNHPHTYYAPDFDVLYDSPILMGNLKTLPSFEIRGVPHHFVGYELGTFDGQEFMNNLKSALEEGIAVIGEIPYPHYTFMAIGPGQGGIEHLNSTSFTFSGEGLDDKEERIDSLLFLAHEYFHHYNVKRIRPIALGPFDYEKPNLTNMLWVSEGFTVYYEYLMLTRAGIITPEQFLEYMRESIVILENNTGRLFQSATESSYQTWTQGPFGDGKGGVRKTISYYNKGTVLGFLLDLKIRHETQNKKSLDDVMQALYSIYYKEKQRGFTDEEFQQVCESIAGCPLPEIFEYASTTRRIDYPKYLAYAGLELEEPEELPDAYLGVIAEDQDDELVIAAVEGDSPARKAGLTAQDVIESADAKSLNAEAFNELLSSKQPADQIELSISRSDKVRKINVTLDHKMEKNFYMKPLSNPKPLQVQILKSITKSKTK